jgi:hypothetical protein
VDDDPHLRIDVAWCPSCNKGWLFTETIVSYSSNPSERVAIDRVEVPDAAVEALLSAIKAAQPESPGQD